VPFLHTETAVANEKPSADDAMPTAGGAKGALTPAEVVAALAKATVTW
jgi:hypothetical protein